MDGLKDYLQQLNPDTLRTLLELRESLDANTEAINRQMEQSERNRQEMRRLFKNVGDLDLLGGVDVASVKGHHISSAPRIER